MYTMINTNTSNSFYELVNQLKTQFSSLSMREEMETSIEDGNIYNTFFLGFRFSPKYNTFIEPRLEICEGKGFFSIVLGGVYDKEGAYLSRDELYIEIDPYKTLSFAYSDHDDNLTLHFSSFTEMGKSLINMLYLHYDEVMF